MYLQFNQSDDKDWHIRTSCLMLLSELEQKIAKLNTDQKNVFNNINSHFQNKNKDPMHIFCTGGAGTGKSFLLKTIVEWINLCYPSFTNSPSVIVTAPTGVAAHNKHGFTLHSVFKLPIQYGYQPQFYELSYTVL